MKMRILSSFAAVLCTGILLVSCKDPVVEKQTLTLDATPLTFTVGSSTTFTVTYGDTDVTSTAAIIETVSGDTLESATWSSDTEGDYTFKAQYDGVESQTVTITVTAEVIPDLPIGFAPSFTTALGNDAPYSAMGVFAFNTGAQAWADAAATATANLLYNQTLSQDGTEWAYEPVVNWPQGAKTSFFAYAPLAGTDNGLSISTQSATGAPVLRYDMGTGDGRTDILISTPNLDMAGSDEAVAVRMRSVMSRIGFRIAGNGEKVSRIAVRGLIEKGSIALDKANDVMGTWTPEEGFTLTEHEMGIVFDEGQEYVTATSEPTNVMAEDGYLYILPQNSTYNTRVVATVDGKDVGFAIQSVTNFQPGQEYIIDLSVSNAPMDYTDNFMPAFVLEAQDTAESNNITWAAAKESCPEGYRLPTYNEALMILVYMNGMENNNFRMASYWASTGYKDDDTSMMGYDTRTGGIYMPSTGITVARCVKSSQGDKKYPYVDTSSPDGPIIVSRDADGGAIPAAFQNAYGADMVVFHDNWTVTPTHDASTDADKISRKLQVANADAGSEKVVRSDLSCPEGWRTPTMNELMLIYAMGGGAQAVYDTDESSRCYNPAVADSPLFGAAGFTPLQGEAYWAESTLSGKGSKTSLTWSFAETGVRGSGSMTGTDANWVRCVRDVE